MIKATILYLDYWNSLLTGSPIPSLLPFEPIPSIAARALPLSSPPMDGCTPHTYSTNSLTTLVFIQCDLLKRSTRTSFVRLQTLSHFPDPFYPDFLFTKAHSTSLIEPNLLIYYVSYMSICPHEVDKIPSPREHFVI